MSKFLSRLAAMGAVAIALGGCQSVSADLDQRSRACAARGGFLTGMGCEGGSGLGAVSAVDQQTPTPVKCRSRESAVTMPDGSTVTKTTEDCSSF